MAPLVPLALGLGGSVLGSTALASIPALATTGILGTTLGANLGGLLGGAVGTAAGNAATGKGFDPLQTALGGLGGVAAGPALGSAIGIGGLKDAAATATTQGLSKAATTGAEVATAAAPTSKSSIDSILGQMTDPNLRAAYQAQMKMAGDTAKAQTILGTLQGGLQAYGQQKAAETQANAMNPDIYGRQSGAQAGVLAGAIARNFANRRARRMQNLGG